MLLVILGAGASHDSNDLLPPEERFMPGSYRPPLTKDLFHPQAIWAELAGNFTLAGPIIQKIRRQQREDKDVSIETVLREISDEALSYPSRHKNLAALTFYLQVVINLVHEKWLAESLNMTNQQMLVDELLAWQATSKQRIVFVTFNYDLLLEAAIESLTPQTFEFMDEYIDDDNIRVYKPHGSVNWARIYLPTGSPFRYSVIINDVRRQVSEGIDRLQSTDKFAVRKSLLGPLNMDEEPVYLPALAVPVARKAEWQFPNDHLNALADDLGQVENVITIGWRGAEDNFIEFMFDHLRPGTTVHIVCESEEASRKAWNNIRHVRRFAAYAPVGTGFSGLMNDPVRLRGILNGQEPTTLT